MLSHRRHSNQNRSTGSPTSIRWNVDQAGEAWHSSKVVKVWVHGAKGRVFKLPGGWWIPQMQRLQPSMKHHAKWTWQNSVPIWDCWATMEISFPISPHCCRHCMNCSGREWSGCGQKSVKMLLYAANLSLWLVSVCAMWWKEEADPSLWCIALWCGNTDLAWNGWRWRAFILR